MAVHLGFAADKVAMWQVILPVLLFPLPNVIPPMAHTHVPLPQRCVTGQPSSTLSHSVSSEENLPLTQHLAALRGKNLQNYEWCSL